MRFWTIAVLFLVMCACVKKEDDMPNTTTDSTYVPRETLEEVSLLEVTQTTACYQGLVYVTSEVYDDVPDQTTLMVCTQGNSYDLVEHGMVSCTPDTTRPPFSPAFYLRGLQEHTIYEVRLRNVSRSGVSAAKVVRLPAAPSSKIRQTDISAVDMGLSVLWANKNLGADVPQEAGDYVAWGETTTQVIGANAFTSSTYSLNEFISFFKLPNSYSGDSHFDAATALLGQGWRTPTIDEMNELLTECRFARAVSDSMTGLLVTGPNGAKIFLPGAGYVVANNVEYEGDNKTVCSGHYAVSSVGALLYFDIKNSGGFGRSLSRADYRAVYAGRSIRAVKDK